MPENLQAPCARWARAVLAGATLCVAGGALAQTAAASPAMHESGVDARIAPGDDFFAYANGTWLEATETRAKGRWGARDEIAEATQRQLAILIPEAAARSAGSSGRKVADFYASCLAAAAIEAKGIAPIAPLLKSVGSLRDKPALARWLGSQLRADVDPLNAGVFASPSHLFGLAVQYGIHGEKHHFAYLLQGGLGLPARDLYSSNSAAAQGLRTQYQAYIAHMLTALGIEGATQRAQAVMALETEIAHSHAPPEESAKESNAENHWTRADFSKQAPGMDWVALFAAAGLSQQKDFVAWQPSALKGAAALVASQPLAVWKDYLRLRIVDRYAEVLPRALSEPALTFRTQVAGAPAQDSPTQRAIVATNQALPHAVGHLYVEKHFSAQTKARVQTILANVTDAFSRRIEAATWMAPATRTIALAKLKTLYFGVGYPETWPDDSRLIIRAGDALGNRQRIADWNYRNALAKLGRPVDTHEWTIAPQRSGAVLTFLQNAYNFSAALLQAPKFDPAASDAANYGAIGAIFGHEISHFVDSLGADYDEHGATRSWWTTDDKLRYEARAQALADQFSGYHPFADVSIDGKLTLVENIADLGGLAAAFDAYRRALGNPADANDAVRRQDRQFFIGFARAWRAKLSDAALRKQASGDDHAPENYRVATVRNIDAWYLAFDVRPGQRLYLEPKARVSVW